MQDEKKDINICVVHAESHAIKYLPSLPRLKEFYQEENGEIQSPK